MFEAIKELITLRQIQEMYRVVFRLDGEIELANVYATSPRKAAKVVKQHYNGRKVRVTLVYPLG